MDLAITLLAEPRTVLGNIPSAGYDKIYDIFKRLLQRVANAAQDNRALSEEETRSWYCAAGKLMPLISTFTGLIDKSANRYAWLAHVQPHSGRTEEESGEKLERLHKAGFAALDFLQAVFKPYPPIIEKIERRLIRYQAASTPAATCQEISNQRTPAASALIASEEQPPSPILDSPSRRARPPGDLDQMIAKEEAVAALQPNSSRLWTFDPNSLPSPRTSRRRNDRERREGRGRRGVDEE